MPTIFFSYSHKDETLRNELEVHLAMLKREALIDTWHDRRILAGDVLDSTIDANLDAAAIIILLISPDFLASKYCYDVEMQRAMARHDRGECRVIAVIFRPCDWQHTPFAKLLVTPTDGKPVTKWADRDEAFLDVAKHIRAALPKPASMPLPVIATQHPATKGSGPRSSNLRLRRTFTEADRDLFLDEAFGYMARFFEASLAELEKRQSGIKTRFKRIDGQAFGAVIYRDGTAVARCGIRQCGSFDRGIQFSDDDSAPANNMSEHLSAEADDQSLYLKPIGMRFFHQERGSHLSLEGAAEYYWSLLIEPLQS